MKITKIGDIFFRFRSYQFVIYLIAAVFCIIGFKNAFDNEHYEFFSFTLLLIGILTRIFTIGYIMPNTSGRNVTGQSADSLNTVGMYSVCRNPLYLGNYFILLSLLVLSQSLYAIIVISALFWIFYTPIIKREEEFLTEKFGNSYLNYKKCINKIIPSFKNFEPAKKPFSLSLVLKREHDTLLTSIGAFILLELIMESIYYNRLIIDKYWLVTITLTFILWTVLKTLKKRGAFLNAE